MAYQLKQYYFKGGSSPEIMTPVSNFNDAKAVRVDTIEQTGVIGTGRTFENEAFYYSSRFNASNTYYFHTKIKKIGLEYNSSSGLKDTGVATYTIYLADIQKINDSSHYEIKKDDEGEYKVQYIKTITVESIPKRNVDPEWVDAEFMFKPFGDFNAIIFILNRISEDYGGHTRHPKFMYYELSIVNDIKGNILNIPTGKNIIKLGVQSKPYFLMNINNEEIRTSRTGIFEVKQGLIPINFFSVVAQGSFNSSTTAKIENAKTAIDQAWAASDYTDNSEATVDSISIGEIEDIGTITYIRNVDPYLVDYLYRD